MEKESIYNFGEKTTVKDSLFAFPESYMKNIVIDTPKRVVTGFNSNVFGEAVVTTGIPVMLKQDTVTYADERTMSYEDYMLSQATGGRKRR